MLKRRILITGMLSLITAFVSGPTYADNGGHPNQAAALLLLTSYGGWSLAIPAAVSYDLIRGNIKESAELLTITPSAFVAGSVSGVSMSAMTPIYISQSVVQDLKFKNFKPANPQMTGKTPTASIQLPDSTGKKNTQLVPLVVEKDYLHMNQRIEIAP